MVEIFSSTFV